jgi:Flp pilus assembly protein TadD
MTRPRFLRSLRLGLIGAIAAAALAAYWPALTGELLWDDSAHVTAAALRSWPGLGRIWTEPGATQQYYPVLHTAFWLEHRLWGDATLGYHLANLGQHLLGALLLGLVLRRLAVPGALLAAAIFALHPVHVESVAWISEQKNTLSLVFYLGAALAYLRFDAHRRPRDYWLGFGLFALALLTKSVTATLPAALLVVGWWQRGRLTWRREIGPLLPWLVVGVAAGLFTAWVERFLIGADGAPYDLTWLQRALLAGRALAFYLGKLFWPAELTFLYPRWIIDPAAGAQWLPLLGACILTFLLWRQRAVSRAPLAAWLLFVGSLFPVLGFLNVYPFRYSFVADHFLYLPSLGLIALLAAAATAGTRGWPPYLRGTLAVGLTGTLALLTAHQAPMYRDAESLYRTTLQRNPECWMAHNNLALLLSARGHRAEALLHLRQAVRLKADYFDGHNNLGLTLTQTGQTAAALPHARQAVQLNPHSAEAWNNLGIALAANRHPHDAVVAFRAAQRFQHGSPSIHDNLAKALRLAGRNEEATLAAETAAQLRAVARRASP